MSDTTPDSPPAPVKLKQPPGLWCLFIVEMWERFSYYGMRAILVLYLVAEYGAEIGNPGRGWTDADASHLYGYYTGLVYLTPILGGLIADRLIGTHRSMVAGSLLIALGHITLAISGINDLAENHAGMSVFIMGLALIILGTGHFKPCVSVMVGQLYGEHDPRRDGGFTIFYMGINVGAFFAPLICGFLGESDSFGWHFGFGAAAVGMILGLCTYLLVRPAYLEGIGDPPQGRANTMPLFIIGSVILAALIGLLYYYGAFAALGDALNALATIIPPLYLTLGGILLILLLATWFIVIQDPGEKGQVFTVLCFIIFNAVFWLAFEQAGSSLTIFAERDTQRVFEMPAWIVRACTETGFPFPWAWWIVIGLALCLPWIHRMFIADRTVKRSPWMSVLWWTLAVLGVNLVWLAIHKAIHPIDWLAGISEMPASWFQAINPFLIVALAPLYSIMWGWLGRRNANPTQSLKIAYGLILLGCGYVFMVVAGIRAADAKVGVLWLAAAYFLHTTGELCLSPTGLSFVTKASPVRWISFIMGLWFLSSVVANFGGGLVAGTVTLIEDGQIEIRTDDGGRLVVHDRVGGKKQPLAVLPLGDDSERTLRSLGIYHPDGVTDDTFEGLPVARAGYRPPASTLGDVIAMINDAPGNDGKVLAAFDDAGLALMLTDATAGNGPLTVTPAGASHTAGDLGVQVPADGATLVGENLYENRNRRQFRSAVKLAELNGGRGVSLTPETPDLIITTRSGDVIDVNLGADADVARPVQAVTTIADVLSRITDAPGNDGKVRAQFTSEGLLLLTDKTKGGGALTVHDGPDATAATDLGIAGTADGKGKELAGDKLLEGIDLSRLRPDTKLAWLNDDRRDNKGVALEHDAVDFTITARDGTVIEVNLGAVNAISDETPLAELNEGAGVFIDQDPASMDVSFHGRDAKDYQVDLTGVTTVGDLAARVSRHTGKIDPFWNQWGIRFKGKGDFFFLFVFSAAVAAVVVLILTPVFKKMLHGVE